MGILSTVVQVRFSFSWYWTSNNTEVCVDENSVKGWWQCKQQKYLLQHKSLQSQRAEAQIQLQSVLAGSSSNGWSWCHPERLPAPPERVPAQHKWSHPGGCCFLHSSWGCTQRASHALSGYGWRLSEWCGGEIITSFVCDLFRHLLHPASPWMPPPGPGSIGSPCPSWNVFSKHSDTTSWQKHWTLWVSIRRGSFRCATNCLCASLGSSAPAAVEMSQKGQMHWKVTAALGRVTVRGGWDVTPSVPYLSWPWFPSLSFPVPECSTDRAELGLSGGGWSHCWLHSSALKFHKGVAFPPATAYEGHAGRNQDNTLPWTTGIWLSEEKMAQYHFVITTPLMGITAEVI